MQLLLTPTQTVLCTCFMLHTANATDGSASQGQVSFWFLFEVDILCSIEIKPQAQYNYPAVEAGRPSVHQNNNVTQLWQSWCFRAKSREPQRLAAMLLLTEALAAFSLSLDNSISIFAWIFSQSTSTWQKDRNAKWRLVMGNDEHCGLMWAW